MEVTVQHDPEPREILPPALFVAALAWHPEAQRGCDRLPASRRLEINRYLTHLKTEESLVRNIKRAIEFLLGKGRFVGREKP